MTTATQKLREAATSVVEVSQVALSVGKAARSTKLWFLLRQSLSKFQRAQDFVQLIGVQQKGASAGYELWRMLNNELSVRSRVEGQALREQVLSLRAPKHISRALDMMRWYTTELLKYDSQIKPRFPELAVTEQEAILAVLRHLDEEAKRYLLLHGTTSSLDALMRGLQFYDEQLRVLTFQKEHQPGKFLNAFADQGKGKDGKGKDGKGKDGKGKDGKGKKGDPKGGQKGAGKRQKTPKGKGKGKQGGRGRSKSRDKSKTSQRTPATIAIRRAIGLQNVHRRKLTNKQRPARPPSRLERSLKLNQPRAKHRMLLRRRVVPPRETARLEPRLERRAPCSCR